MITFTDKTRTLSVFYASFLRKTSVCVCACVEGAAAGHKERQQQCKETHQQTVICLIVWSSSFRSSNRAGMSTSFVRAPLRCKQTNARTQTRLGKRGRGASFPARAPDLPKYRCIEQAMCVEPSQARGISEDDTFLFCQDTKPVLLGFTHDLLTKYNTLRRGKQEVAISKNEPLSGWQRWRSSSQDEMSKNNDDQCPPCPTSSRWRLYVCSFWGMYVVRHFLGYLLADMTAASAENTAGSCRSASHAYRIGSDRGTSVRTAASADVTRVQQEGSEQSAPGNANHCRHRHSNFGQ